LIFLRARFEQVLYNLACIPPARVRLVDVSRNSNFEHQEIKHRHEAIKGE
jgi:hypothetical protein